MMVLTMVVLMVVLMARTDRKILKLGRLIAIEILNWFAVTFPVTVYTCRNVTNYYQK